MPEYPSNSDRQNLPQQPPENYQKHVTSPVINGGASRKEKTAWDSVREFFGFQECNSFRDYVSVLSDMTNRVYGAIDTLLGNRKFSGSNVPGARINYTSYYNSPVNQQQTQVNNAVQTSYGASGIVFDNRVDAEVVLGKMFELLQMYQNVSVGDMFDLAGLTSPNGYTDFKYGWRDLNGSRVVPFGSKWVIQLPSTIPLR